MNLTAVITHITAQCPGYTTVSGALNLFDVITNAPMGAHAWVGLASENADKSTAENRVFQKVNVEFSVLTLLRADPSDASGALGYEALEALRTPLQAALIGYQIDVDTAPISFIGGVPSELNSGFYLWEDNFTTHFYRGQL